MSYDEYEGRRSISLPFVIAGLAAVAAVGISLFAVASVREQSMVGPPAGANHTWYLLLEVDSLDVLAAMTQRVRATVDGVRMDKYVRFQARIGRPFFLLE